MSDDDRDIDIESDVSRIINLFIIKSIINIVK